MKTKNAGSVWRMPTGMFIFSNVVATFIKNALKTTSRIRAYALFAK